MKKVFYLFIIVCFFFGNALQAQDRYLELQKKLTTLANNDIPQLNEKVNISVTNVPIQEFLRGVANSSGLNINVEPGLRIDVINNFSNVKVIDILLFLVKQYDLDISVIGNIVNIFKVKPEPIIQQPVPKKVLVNYDRDNALLSIQCENEDLINVAREMIDKTGRNVVPASGLDRAKVSAYIQKMQIDNALEKFAYANNLKIRKTDDQVFLIEKMEAQANQNVSNIGQRKGSSKNPFPSDGRFIVRVNRGDSLSVEAEGASISDIIKEAAEQLKKDIFFTSAIQGESTLTLKNISFQSLLEYLFRNTTYAYQVQKGIYILGDSKNTEMKEFRVLQLQNRTIEKILEIIPADLKADMDLKEFPELNSIVAGGLPSKITALESFLRSIDKTVPVILIEVMFVDSKDTHAVSTGIEAGIDSKPTSTQGQVFPDANIDLSSQSINKLINSFNGFGTFKIGAVTPNFYMKLKAMENDGIIDIHSTPKLSTLNGHEASMKIGRTEYYREQQNNIYGSLSAQSTTIDIYKPVEANLEVKIKPFVSGDDQVTLDIEVTQEDFTDRITQYSPPGKVNRTFKALVRVKDQEMILLGGLEEKTVREDGTGVPLLSRIPVLKWFFSSKSKTNSKSKLNIFIKPSIIN